MSSKTNVKKGASLVGAVFLALFVAAASFGAFAQIQKASAARNRSHSIVDAAQRLQADLVDAETGQRGYLLTGDETFLDPYEAVRAGIPAQQRALAQMADSPQARQHLDILAPLVEANMRYLGRNIESRRSHGPAIPLADLRGNQGKALMDAIRGQLGTFIQLERQALAHHENEFQATMRILFTVIVIISLFAMICAAAFVYFVELGAQQQLKNLAQADARHLLAIQEAITRQLQSANRDLQRSEENLAVTLNSIGDAVIATDLEARITRINHVAEKLTGWTQAEAQGRDVAEVFRIVNQDTRNPAVIPVMETLAKGSVQGLANHTVLIDRNLGECDIADSCAPIRDRDGQVVGAVLVFRDVTEDYAAQRALRDSAALIQGVLNTVLDGIITFRAEGGQIDTVNPAVQRMFGYSAEEILHQGVGVLIPELLCQQAAGTLAAYCPSAEALAVGQGREVTGRRKDGGRFPVEMAVSALDLGGRRYFTGILRDLSSRKEAEDALKKAGALQNAIFNSETFSSIATDAKGVIQIFNVGAETMLGYSASEVLNKITPADISDPQELITRANALSSELNTRIAPGFEALAFKAARCIEDIYELTYIRKDGSRLPALVSVTALRDEAGGIIGYLLIGTDNTARKQIEAEQAILAQRLRDNQFYTRSLFEANMDALMTSDPSGMITDVNKQMEALTGYSRHELIGSPFKNCFTDPERAENSIQLVLSERKITNFELTARARDGRETVVSYNATTFYDRDRKLQGMFAAARDVTERKALDLVLQERNSELVSARVLAEKANLAKSDFLSSMSHELRSPLNAILGFAQLMENDELPPTPNQQESIAQILKAGWHLLKLINEILDLAKIESRQIPISQEPVALAEVVLECQAMVELQAHQRGLTLHFPQLKAPFYAQADRTRVKQVLLNLLSNAIKYNNPKGRVEVTCEARSPDRVRVSVRDTGAGLAAEQLDQLFQAFNRLGQETGVEEGTGIGLVVARQLVELMGGSIGVASTVGAGSVFWFELASVAEPLPLSYAGDALDSKGRTLSVGSRVQTLLYVEDNPANLKLVEQIMARHPGTRLLTAVDGNQGFDLARAALPDVILMDINLPGIDGYEALRRLRADPSTAPIPVLAVSANAMPRDIKRGLEAGFFRYITKPIVVKEFVRALEVALAHAGQAGSQIPPAILPE